MELIHLATNGFTSTRALLLFRAPAPSPPSPSPASHDASPAVMDLFNLERERLVPESAAPAPDPDADFGVGLVDEEEDEARPTCLFKSRLMVSVFCEATRLITTKKSVWWQDLGLVPPAEKERKKETTED